MPRIAAVKDRDDTVARTHGPAVRPAGGDRPRRRAERESDVFECALPVDTPSRGKAQIAGPRLHPGGLRDSDPVAEPAVPVLQAQAPGRDERGACIEHGAGPVPKAPGQIERERRRAAERPASGMVQRHAPLGLDGQKRRACVEGERAPPLAVEPAPRARERGDEQPERRRRLDPRPVIADK